MARPAELLRRRPLRGQRRGRAAPVLRRDHSCPGLAVDVPPRRVNTRTAWRPARTTGNCRAPRGRARRDAIQLPAIEPTRRGDDDPITITYSELAAFIDCGTGLPAPEPDRLPAPPRSRAGLRQGRPPRHAGRRRGHRGHRHGPNGREIDDILDASFFLPTANKPAHRQLKDAASRLSTTYAEKYEATCTESGRPSAPSSCTSTASRSPAAPT